jgi:hypothetical protein
MTILFDATRPVKSTRRFGAGILASAPHYHVSDHSVSDEAWLAEDNTRREYEAWLDRLEAESDAIRRHELGLCL